VLVWYIMVMLVVLSFPGTQVEDTTVAYLVWLPAARYFF